MSEIKQFMLASGDEIICEVIEWANDTDPDLVIRRAYNIVTVDDPARGVRYFTLRPWMLYQSGDDMFNMLSSDHIIGQANPDASIIKQYHDAIEESERSEQDFKERVSKLAEKLAASEDMINNDTKDSSDDNIVYFGRFEKDKLH